MKPNSETPEERDHAKPATEGGSFDRLNELMVTEGIVSEEQLSDARKYQREHGGKIPLILVHLGHLSAKVLHEFLEKSSRMPSLDLSNFRSLPNPSELVAKEFAVANQVFPIDKIGRLLTVASAVPLDASTLEELQSLTGLTVKAVLCNRDDISNAIETHYPRMKRLPGRTVREEPQPSVSEIRLAAVQQILDEIGSLPTLSQTVRRVQEAVGREDVGVADVAAIIEHDPPLTANVLKLANSAAYGFRNEVNDIYRAATLLGLRETESVVISSAVISVAESSEHFDYQAYWDDAMFGGLAARAISEAVGRHIDGAAFTAGLLHDIGRFALSRAASGRYSKVSKRLRGEGLLKAENEHLGIAHHEAGYVLAQRNSQLLYECITIWGRRRSSRRCRALLR